MKNTNIFYPLLLILFSLSFSQDFDINQSQQQAVYFIDSVTLDGVDQDDSGNFILARTADGTLVGATEYNGYGTDLIVMGQDLDIVVDNVTYSVCQETGTCGYPIMGDLVYLTLYKYH